MEDENKITPEAENTTEEISAEEAEVLTEQDSLDGDVTLNARAATDAISEAVEEQLASSELTDEQAVTDEEVTSDDEETSDEKDPSDEEDSSEEDEMSDEIDEAQNSDEAVESMLSDVLSNAVINGEISGEDAAQIRQQVLQQVDRPEETEKPPKGNKKLVVTLCCCIGVLMMAVGVLVGYLLLTNDKTSVWNGLKASKDYSKYIELVDYSSLTYTNSYTAPTDEDVMTEIHSKMSDYSKTEDVKDGIKNGDVANIDFTGYIDGEKNDKACGTGHDLTIGSGQFISGLEDGLLGRNVGENVTLNLTFPNPYQSDTSLSGKAVRFEVKINSVKRTTYQELTDEIVKKISENAYDSVKEYKAYVQQTLETDRKNTAQSTAQTDLWKNIVENSKLKTYPQKMYDYFADKLDTQYKSYYSQYGVSDLEGFMKANNLELQAYIEDQMKYEFAIYTIAKQQEIEITQEDIDTLLKKYNYDSKDALLEAQGMKEFELEEYILYNKVSAYLYNAATAK